LTTWFLSPLVFLLVFFRVLGFQFVDSFRSSFHDDMSRFQADQQENPPGVHATPGDSSLTAGSFSELPVQLIRGASPGRETWRVPYRDAATILSRTTAPGGVQ
jgi:hypothetical protein